MALQLTSDEKIIDQWTLNFIGEERIFSKFVITNKQVYFAAGGLNFPQKTDPRTGGALFVPNGDMLAIPRESIASVEAFRKFFIFQRFRITTTTGDELVFDRGIMPVGGIVSLLNSK